MIFSDPCCHWARPCSRVVLIRSGGRTKLKLYWCQPLSITDFSPLGIFTEPQVKDHPVKYIEFYLNNEACRWRQQRSAGLQEGVNVRNWGGGRARLSRSGTSWPGWTGWTGPGESRKYLRVKMARLAWRWHCLTQTWPALEPSHSVQGWVCLYIFCMLISQGK